MASHNTVRGTVAFLDIVRTPNKLALAGTI
jgi:hypothetical protein